MHLTNTLKQAFIELTHTEDLPCINSLAYLTWAVVTKKKCFLKLETGINLKETFFFSFTDVLEKYLSVGSGQAFTEPTCT
jgi:hypothetical protein